MNNFDAMLATLVNESRSQAEDTIHTYRDAVAQLLERRVGYGNTRLIMEWEAELIEVAFNNGQSPARLNEELVKEYY